MTTLLSMSGVALRLLSTASTDAFVFLSGGVKGFGLTDWQLPCGRGAGSGSCPLHGVSANAAGGSSNAAATESAMESNSGNDDLVFMGPALPRHAPVAAHHSS